MSTTITEIEYCKLKVEYEVGREEISSKKDDVIKSFKDRKLPGFRKGKATTDAIKSFLKKEIHEALSQELAKDAAQNVITENNIKPFGQPNFSMIHLEENSFKCEFSINKQPDFQLSEYKEFEIPKPSSIMSVDELSQKMMEDLRNRFGKT
jgi:FKBP-type peptidyl-prolyl cis-trans isomerase (trigger factor)